MRDRRALEAERAHASEAAHAKAPASTATAKPSTAGPGELERIVLSIERSHDALALVVQNHGTSSLRMKPGATLERMQAAGARPVAAKSQAITGFRLDACDQASSTCIELAPGGELRAAELRTREAVRCGCAPCARLDPGDYAFVVHACSGPERAHSGSFALDGDRRAP